MDFYILLGLGAFVGGFVNGLAGFGTGLFALSFFLAIMPPIQAVAIIVIMSVFTGALGMFTVRDFVPQNSRAILRLTIPGLLAVPLGVWALSFVNVEVLRLLVAVILLVYGCYFLLQSNISLIKGHFPVLDMMIGAIGGVLGGLAALSGAMPTMWLAMRDFDKPTTRTVLQSYNLALLSLTSVLLMINGAYTGQSLFHAIIAIIIALSAARIGLALFKRLNTSQFRQLLVVITFLSGVMMMIVLYTG